MERKNNSENQPFANASAVLFGQTTPSFDLRSAFGKPETASNEVPANAPEGSYTYALVQSGPAVPADEIEQSQEAIEIMILWGTSILHVAHLSPPRSFHVGEENADFVLPENAIGAKRLPVVLVGEDKVARVVVSASAHGSIENDGKSSDIDATNAEPCAALAGAAQIAVGLGAKVKLDLGGVTIHVSRVKAGKKVKGGIVLDKKGLPWHGLSFALHAGLLAAAAFFLPPMGADEENSIEGDKLAFMQQALNVTAEREQDKKESPEVIENQDKNAGGTEGTRSIGSEGKMGSTTSRNSSGKFAIFGPKDNTDPQVARAAALSDAQTFGMIGLVATLSGGDPNAVTAPWGGDISMGSDARSALGNMWGASLDEAAGAGGLGLSGLEQGGGGKGEGIGLNRIGTIGTDLSNQGGFSRGITRNSHQTKPPRVRPEGATTVGRLPAEVVQRIVRQNFGRYRFCYEQGLRQNPNLQGRVAVRFVIGRDGGVSQVQNGGSDMPDANVVSCVVRSFYGLSFPAPEHGIVTVNYPIMFQPGG
ncbi:MAG: AgmX/PglI C-terminal domain-containing protein [Polyangiaceae bacterium]|nr:AgmX/PglI C-terminal domain-containing protein [Polyangiaceae bacterium]